MSAIDIRPYLPADIPAVTRIYGHYVRDTVITFETEEPGEAEMASRFATIAGKGHPLLIAAEAGQVIGYAYASTYRPREAYRFTCEDSIYLAPDAVGKGLGGTLLAALLDESKRFGFRHVGVYSAVGYKFDRWLDIVHMQRGL